MIILNLTRHSDEATVNLHVEYEAQPLLKYAQNLIKYSIITDTQMKQS